MRSTLKHALAFTSSKPSYWPRCVRVCVFRAGNCLRLTCRAYATCMDARFVRIPPGPLPG